MFADNLAKRKGGVKEGGRVNIVLKILAGKVHFTSDQSVRLVPSSKHTTKIPAFIFRRTTSCPVPGIYLRTMSVRALQGR